MDNSRGDLAHIYTGHIYNRLAADCKFRYQVKSSYRWHYVDIKPLRWSPGRTDTVNIWRKVTSAAIYNELGAMEPVGHTREEQLCLTATAALLSWRRTSSGGLETRNKQKQNQKNKNKKQRKNSPASKNWRFNNGGEKKEKFLLSVKF